MNRTVELYSKSEVVSLRAAMPQLLLRFCGASSRLADRVNEGLTPPLSAATQSLMASVQSPSKNGSEPIRFLLVPFRCGYRAAQPLGAPLSRGAICGLAKLPAQRDDGEDQARTAQALRDER